jgi:hypothetical protein
MAVKSLHQFFYYHSKYLNSMKCREISMGPSIGTIQCTEVDYQIQTTIDQDHFSSESKILTPKGPRPFFGPFLKFGQAIVDAIFVQKISNFRWTCGLVLASRCTNFYEIPISNLGAMPQKQNYFEVRAAWAAKKLFIF